MKSRPAVVVAAVAVVLAVWLGLAGALGAPFERRAGVKSTAHASASALPVGWQRSPVRLVPLLMPPWPGSITMTRFELCRTC